MFENIAVVGATGAVGRLVCELLEQRAFPYRTIKFLASERSAGKTIVFAGRPYVVEALRPEAFDEVDLVISSTPDDMAAQFVPWAVERGAVVVDESGHWRMKPHVPLVVPEVNPEAIHEHQGIIASPNCSTTQMVVALKPLHDAARVRRVIVTTYQAASGVGVAGQRELYEATRAALDGRAYTNQAFAHPIAFNLIPHIGSPREEGYTSEEMKMVYETRKILRDDSIRICATCVRVPVANAHSESIVVETERPLSVEEARRLFAEAPGIVLLDALEDRLYPMPIDCSGKDEVFVGRVRRDFSSECGLAFWCVSDNLRKGAATNAVQIAELLVASQAAV